MQSTAITHVPAAQAAAVQQIIAATKDSAGSTIPALRLEGISGRMGQAEPPLADALSAGVADATRLTLFAATAFLLIGLLFAIRLLAVSHRRQGIQAGMGVAFGSSKLARNREWSRKQRKQNKEQKE